MRQSRVKVRREHKGKKLSFIIIFTLIWPLSIVLGYLCTKHLILPNLTQSKIIKENQFVDKKVLQVESEDNKKNESNNEPVKEAYLNTFEIEGFDIFSIQIGSFTTKENAQGLVKELNNKQNGGYVWYNDGYKVMTISMLDRQSIDEFMIDIKQQYNQAFIVVKSIPTRAIKYNEKDSRYAMLLGKENEKIIQIFNDLSGIIKKRKNNLIDANECNNSIKMQIKNLKDIEDEIKKSSPSKGMQPIHNDFIQFVENFTKDLEYAMKDDVNSFILIQNSFMKGLYQYSDFATENEY